MALRILILKFKRKCKNKIKLSELIVMDALVYLPDIETLLGIHADWPEDVRAMLILHKSGRCEMRLCHCADDGAVELEAILEQIALDGTRIQVVPRTGSHPTRQLSFAEEQRLCGLLYDVSDLPEIAVEYAFARRSQKELMSPSAMERRGSMVGFLSRRNRRKVRPQAPVETSARTSEGERDASKVQACHEGDEGACATAIENDCLIANIIEAGDEFRVVLDDVGPAPGPRREVCGRIIAAPTRGCSVRVTWDGDLASGDVVKIQRKSLPPAAVALWRRGDLRVRFKLVADGAIIDP